MKRAKQTTYRVTWTDGTVIDVTASDATNAKIKARLRDQQDPDLRGPKRREGADIHSARRREENAGPDILVNLFKF